LRQQRHPVALTCATEMLSLTYFMNYDCRYGLQFIIIKTAAVYRMNSSAILTRMLKSGF